MFKALFSFKGRIRRTEFGISYIVYAVFVLILNLMIELKEDTVIALVGLFYIPALWFLWAQGAKRCHDRGNSGFYQIIPFYILWMLFADSEYGDNSYGPNPKGIGNATEIDDIGKNSE